MQVFVKIVSCTVKLCHYRNITELPFRGGEYITTPSYRDVTARQIHLYHKKY